MKQLRAQLEEEKRQREEAESLCDQREEELRGLSVNLDRLEQDYAKKDVQLVGLKEELQAVTLRLEAVQQARGATTRGEGGVMAYDAESADSSSNQMAEIFLLQGEVVRLKVRCHHNGMIAARNGIEKRCLTHTTTWYGPEQDEVGRSQLNLKKQNQRSQKLQDDKDTLTRQLREVSHRQKAQIHG